MPRLGRGVAVIATRSAQAHIDEIGAHIAHDSLDAALKVYDAFEDAFGLLAKRRALATRARIRRIARSSSGASFCSSSSTTLKKPTAHDYCGPLRRSRCRNAAEALSATRLRKVAGEGLLGQTLIPIRA